MADIHVEVVYALPEHHESVQLRLPEGACVKQAIEASGLLALFPDIDPGGRNKLGIYARLVKPDEPLRDQDRLEIYRPLIADPKAVRKKRAEDGKVMKKGGSSG
jgi:uncharacterized protein